MLTSVHQIIFMDDAKGKTNNCFWILCKVPHKRVKRKILKNSSDSAGCWAKVKKKEEKLFFPALTLWSFPFHSLIIIFLTIISLLHHHLCLVSGAMKSQSAQKMKRIISSIKALVKRKSTKPLSDSPLGAPRRLQSLPCVRASSA